MDGVCQQQPEDRICEQPTAALGGGTCTGLEVRLAVRPPTARTCIAMIAIELFIGIPAIPAGVGLIRNGLGMPADWIRHSLFPDYAVPGVLLIILIGAGMIGAAVVTMRWPVLAGPAGIMMGSVQVAWLAIETFILGWHGGPQGLLIAVIGMLAAALVVLGARVVTIHHRVVEVDLYRT
jgi:hypothetical protein